MTTDQLLDYMPFGLKIYLAALHAKPPHYEKFLEFHANNTKYKGTTEKIPVMDWVEDLITSAKQYQKENFLTENKNAEVA